MLLRYGRQLAISSAIALLAACGGGDNPAPSGPTLQSPPETAASLSASTAEASEAVKAVVAGGSAVAVQDSSPDALFLPTGDPFAARSPGASAVYGRAAGRAREQAQAVTTLGCTEFFEAPCLGSLSLDTNLAANSGASTIPAGAYMAFNFNALEGSANGRAIQISGALRVDFLTALDTDATSFANVRFQVASVGLAGSVNGEAFGPRSRVALVAFDAQGAATITAEGRSFSHLSGVSITDSRNYTIGTATVRTAYWADPSRHVDCAFQDWRVAAGLPMAGSQVTVSGSGGGMLVVLVTASSSSVVVYDVLLSAGGMARRYAVTAANPTSGTSVYTVVEVAV